MWLVETFILKQLHFSFFLANHIKTNLCCQCQPLQKKHVRLSTTSRDASVGVCHKIYFSKYKYPFESDETFITEFRWQRCAFKKTIFFHILACFVPNSITCRTFFAHFVSILVLFVSVIGWHVWAFHGRWPNLLSTLFLTRSAKGSICGTDKQTN